MNKYIKNIFYKIKNYKKTNDLVEIEKIVNSINYFSNKFKKLTDDSLSNKTKEFKDRLLNNNKIDDILIESFAVVKESCRRIFKINLFDTQIIGGIILHKGNIAEMATGEGKTIAAILPAYLNSLIGKGVHIVTMNDYLAKRDANNNRLLFNYLGIKVGINISNMSKIEKKDAYDSDITYGTNHEYCFDYLKDNMVFDLSERVQKELNYAIIDEIDSILIDEARTPLIISEYDKNFSDTYIKINKLVKYFLNENLNLNKNNNKYFITNLKSKEIFFTEIGFELLEKLIKKLGFIKKNDDLYTEKNIIFIQYMINALKANIFFKKNVDYLINDKGKVIIIDEHTGRISKGRRWSEGIHQSIEAKENLIINNENRILSSITFQNYFNLYNKLSGMTGTAYTEREEFKEIYNLKTIQIPTNKKMIRKDYSDLIFITEEAKFNAIVKDIIVRIKNNQPVLIGTTSIEKSEKISNFLKKFNIKHNILNAKYHELEAEIISQAGKPKSVTIATNMAGRGTDIILGGNLKELYKNLIENNEKKKLKDDWKKNNNIVIKSGGLHVIGTERHESRRIDNQLRGRSGRQGDPGSSQFYLSIEDELIKIFVSTNIINFIKSKNKNFKESINNKWINKIIESAQLKIEKRNFNIRKQLITYDNIINNQRDILYKIRNNLLYKEKLNNIYIYIYKDLIYKILNKNILNNILNFENIKIIEKELYKELNLVICIKFNYIKNQFNKNIKKILFNFIINNIINYEKKFNSSKLYFLKKIIFLKTLDTLWKIHIESMNILKKNIFLRSYANKDPRQEYQIESFYLFKKMIFYWKFESINILNKFFYIHKNNIINNSIILEYELFNNNEINYLIKYLNDI